MVQLRLAKPKAIIFDMSGTVAKTFFIEKVLVPYIRSNMKEYLDAKWSDKELQKDVERLRKQSTKEEASGSAKIADKNASDEEVKESVINNVTWHLDNKQDSRAHQMFRFHMLFDGYATDKVHTPIYSDVALQLQKWHFTDNIKFYVYSNGWIEAQKIFLSHTNHGDLSPVISDYFDTTNGPLTEPESFRKILEKIGLKDEPEHVLFLCKSGEEASAAKEAGITSVLVLTHRKNVEKLADQHKTFPHVRSFMELEFE